MAKQLCYGSVEIYIDDILGVGSYGKVCKGKCGQLPCAVKLLHDTMFQHGDPGIHSFERRFEQECQFLSSIKHPNIVQYLGIIANPESRRPVLLMELMDESLTKYLERSTGPLLYYTQVDICHDVALALAYLHFNAIIHRDLSGNNVLLIGVGSRAKVSDFGMSKLVDINPRMTPLTQCPGASVYMPPEALITSPGYSSKLDCFSFGVLGIQIVTRKFPNPGDAFTYIKDPKYPTGRALIPVPEIHRRKEDIDLISADHALLPIMLRCIKDLDEERPSADELCEELSSLEVEARYMCSKDQSNDQLSLVQRLQLEVETKEQEIQSKEITMETITKEFETTLQQKTEEHQKELERAIQRITEEHKRELQQKAEELRQKTEELQQKTEEHKRELQQKAEELRQKTEELQWKTEEHKRELQQKAEELRQKTEELQRKTEEHKRELQQKAEELRQKTEELQRKTEEHKRELQQKAEELRQKTEELQRKTEEHKRELQQKAEELRQKTEELQRKTEEHKRELQQKAEELRQKTEELQRKTEEHKRELQQKAEELQQKAEELQQKTEELQRKTEEHKRELQQKAEELRQKTEELQRKTEEHKRELQQKAEELQQKTEELQWKTEDKRELQQKAEELQQKTEELQQKTEELQQKAEEHQRELEEKEQIIQRLRDLNSGTDVQHKEDEMDLSDNVSI